MNEDRSDPQGTADDVDLENAHPARVYDYFLRGKNNYEVDRVAAARLEAALPDIPLMARRNRDFMHRAVRRLVGVHGIRQFLDIGSGIPTRPNLHETAQDIDPAVRVVYVDYDHLVGAHSRALLASSPEGRVAFLLADATDPAAILAHPTVTETLDLAEPVALMLVSVLMYFEDATARAIVDTLLAGLPSGSYLTISHPTGDFAPDVIARAAAVASATGLTYIPRSRDEVERLFAGVRLDDPGLVAMPAWHPTCDITSDIDSLAASTHYWVGMGRKP
jgi:hypothetical protein